MRKTLDDEEIGWAFALLDAIHKYGNEPTPNNWVAVTRNAERLRRAVV